MASHEENYNFIRTQPTVSAPGTPKKHSRIDPAFLKKSEFQNRLAATEMKVYNKPNIPEPTRSMHKRNTQLIGRMGKTTFKINQYKGPVMAGGEWSSPIKKTKQLASFEPTCGNAMPMRTQYRRMI